MNELHKVMGQQEMQLVSDHPVCGAKVGSAEILLMPQPPLLTRRGIPLRGCVKISVAAGIAWLARKQMQS